MLTLLAGLAFAAVPLARLPAEIAGDVTVDQPVAPTPLPLPLPPRRPAQAHTGIILAHSGEFAAGSGLVSLAVGFGAQFGTGDQSGLVSPVGSVLSGFGVAGLVIGVPVFIVGTVVERKGEAQAGVVEPGDGAPETRGRGAIVGVRLGVSTEGVVVSGGF